jgi:tetratricopeptide (TPR) repeat protein
MNQAALTDDGSLYAETQCGAMETQLDFNFLPPGRIRRWREWWLPLHGLGGLTCASVEMGATIHLAKDKNPEHVNLTLGICPARPLSEVTVRLSVQEKTLLEQKANATPGKPWLHTEVIEAQRLAGYPLTLTVMDNSGQVILDYTHDREVCPVEPFPLQADTKPSTAQDLYSVGLKHENFDNRQEALETYQKGLAMDSAHGPSHLRLGLMFMRAANLTAAEEHFRQAAVAGLAEANYYLGTLLLSLDRLEEAERAFEAAPAGTSVSAAARCGLGRIALGKGEWEKSVDLLRQALTEDPDASSVARLLLAVALRRAGREKEAQLELQGLLSNDPLNHPALREMALSLGDQGRPYLDKLARMLADDRQYLLDLACFYINTRLFADALVILGEAVRAWNYPMVGYLAWDMCRRLGKSDEASEWLIKSTQAGPDLVFPSRLEEVAALTQAVKENPHDYKAKYYLGTFLYAHQRFEEGLTLWEEAAEHLGDFDVVYRNLGLAYWKVKGDLQRATTLLETAQQINPENQDLYLLLDELYTTQRLREKREALLEKLHALNDLRDDVHKHMVVMLVDLGHYQRAIQRLTEDRFVPSEMDQSFRLAYVGAYLGRAQAQIKAGRLEEAIADYRRALQFPENVGVGQPVSGANAEILYRLGWAWEQLGRFEEAIAAWQGAAGEHHPHGSKLFPFVQMSLDKLNRYSELGYY